MLKKLAAEYAFFREHPRNMRVLLLTNFIFAAVLPIIELFTGTYIIRNSADFSLVIVFQLAQYTGIPIIFLVNAYLLNKVSICKLYSVGMMLSGISMAIMMLLNELNAFGVSAAGFIMGLSFGFFWSNRVYLALTSTKDENRNYYYGLETFLYTFAFITVPFLAGVFISTSQRLGWFQGNLNAAYYVLTVLVFLLTLLASYIIHKGDFKNPKKAAFIFVKFHRLWRKTMLLAPLRGIAQGFMVSAPVMLVMKLVGGEGSLGIIQSVGAVLSAILLYLLGRKSNTGHRLAIFGSGLLIFVLGALANAAMFSAFGVILFVACLIFAKPLMDLSYFPVQLGVIEFMAAKEKRNEFAYIFSHELGLYLGRVSGCLLFIGLARLASEEIALRYALLIIALIQFLSVFIMRSILHDRAWHEPLEDDLLAMEKLKKPS